MKVCELIEQLQQLDQEADVCVECRSDATIWEVKQYNHISAPKDHVVYIGDDLTYIDEIFEEVFE